MDTAKSHIFSRLKLLRHGPRYMHFPEGNFGFDLEYFEQLVSEHEETTWTAGKVTRKWVKTRARNEALDKMVYLFAAIEVLRPNFDAIARNMTGPTLAKEYTLKDGAIAPVPQQPAAGAGQPAPVAGRLVRRTTPLRRPGLG